MDFKIAYLEENDYDVLCEYWKFWRFPAPPKSALPDNGICGLKIIDEKRTIICAGFLYSTNSSIAWLEFIVSNPDIKDKKIRHESITSLIRYLTVLAEQKGFEIVFSSIKNENLINKYLEVGFVASEAKTTELTIKL